MLGDDTELHLEADGHGPLVDGCPGRDGQVGRSMLTRFDQQRSSEMAGRRRALYAGRVTPDSDPQFTHADAARVPRERRQQFGLRDAAPGRRSARPPRRRARPRAGSPGTRRRAAGTARRRWRRRSRSRAQAQLVLQPEARAVAGIRSPIRAIGRRRLVVVGHDACPADQTGPLGPGPDLPVVAIARRAGSRSSSVVVVTKAWGSAAIRRTRCARRSGRARRRRRRAGGAAGARRGRHEVELGELEGEDRGPLLAARREAARSRPASSNDDVVAVRPDERGAVPDLLLGRLDEAPGERVPWRLAGRPAALVT